MPLPPGAKLLSLPPGAKLVTAASAPMTETKAPEQTGMISSFVKGLKTFTPPLGAGSVYNEEETSAALNKARTDPAGYLADQIPFVSQIKKIVSDLKGGKDKGDVAAEAIGELVAGAAGSPPIMKGGATPATARARYGGGLAETPKPSKPVNVGGLMEMAKTGKDILQVLKSPNPLTKLSALGRLFEKFASEVTPIEAPPAPTVVEAPPVASGTPVRPPLRGKQFGTFNDPAAPPLPAGVEPSGPVRPPLQGRQFGTTVAKMMREEVPGRQFGTSSQSRLVPAEVPPAAVETPQPATPARIAGSTPTTAATLMEEAANPAQVNNPNVTWRTPTGMEAAFQQYLKDSGLDVRPERPPFDPTDPKGQGRSSGGAKMLNNIDLKSDRFAEYLADRNLEPTPDNVARATEALGEAAHPSALDLEMIYKKLKYTPSDLVELLARSVREKPVARAGNSGNINANGRPNAIREVSAPDGNAPAGARPSTGKKTDVFIPGERQSIPARYEVRELGEIKSSHNGQTFSHNPEYELQNERDYSKPENQQRVIEQSSEDRFRHQLHITDNPDMSNGPPLLDEGGNALGGNSRTMHLQRVYGRNEGAAKAYRQYLIESAQHFGIDPASITGMKQPVLVRIVSDDGLATVPGGAKWAIRKTNVPGGAALSASERAAADAGQMSPDLMSHISSAIENEGAGATLNDALAGQSGTRIVNKLIEDGFFSEQERPGLMDGRTGALTQLAKDRISKALLGKFFRDSDQISRTPASIRNVLERASAPIARIAEDKAWDVTNDVKEAVDLIEYARAHDIKNLADVVGQESMFGDAPEWSDGAVKIAEMLRDAKPNDVVNAFRKYANSKEPTMFGESTPGEAFKEIFGADKPKAKK